MRTRIVRAVDSGNIQRSPAFQAVFSYYFSEPGTLPFPIIFDSAGIDVDDIMANRTPAWKKLGIIEAARHYDLFRGDNIRLAEELLSKWSSKSETQIPDEEKARITMLYSGIKTDVHTLQMRFRNEALQDAGVPERYLPGMRVPFRHNEHLGLILPVDERAVGKVENYYRLSGFKQPPTRLYGSLVGRNPLEDELTGGIVTARKQVKYFRDTRERAMKEIVRLLSEETGR